MDSIEEIHAGLDALEDQVGKLVGGSADKPEQVAPSVSPQASSAEAPVRASRGPYRGKILAVLQAAVEQHPKAWIPVHVIADFIHERGTHTQVKNAATRLIADGVVETIKVSFNGTQRVLIRLPSEPGEPDIAAIETQVNTALAPIGQRIAIYPARRVESNFRAVEVLHGGRTYRGYVLDQPYTVRTNP